MSKILSAVELVNVPEVVAEALRTFFESLGRDVSQLGDETDLLKGMGASSDEGVDFAIDLSDTLGIPVPDDFNPFVHESGRRGMKVKELIEHAREFLRRAKEAANAS